MTNLDLRELFEMQWTSFKGIIPETMDEFVKCSMAIVPMKKYGIVTVEVPHFKPYDKILVRDINEKNWKPTLFSHYDEQGCVRDINFMHWDLAIPYERNEKIYLERQHKIQENK